jgi:hypothetical protein
MVMTKGSYFISAKLWLVPTFLGQKIRDFFPKKVLENLRIKPIKRD